MRNETHSRAVFPVGLLIEDRPCLVVGSGNVAAHKTNLLLDAKARVTVVGPDANKKITALAEAKSINYLQREFTDSDVKDAFLVFAATNDKTANRHVMECCRRHCILCCTVDSNWSSSDFVTPAIIRRDDLTVSISSGGKSCRKTRLVKENFARHLEMAESADLAVIGTSHHQMSVQRREPFHLTGPRLDETGRMLMQVCGVHEFMLFNTCNRVEFIGVISNETRTVDLLKRIMGFSILKEDEYYVKKGFAAFEHVALMSAGLLSRAPGGMGRNDIDLHVRKAMEYSTAQKWAGDMIEQWIEAALLVSNDVRQVTEPLSGASEREKPEISKVYNSAARS